MLISLAMSIAAAGAAGTPVVPAIIDCHSNLAPRTAQTERRSVTDKDLIETLDLGYNAGLETGSFFSVGPDRRVAAAIRRADIDSNSYCTGIMVIDAAGSARLIDAGPGAAFWRFDNFYGTNGFPTGSPKLITPRWSSDGQSLGFLKFVDGKLQLWLWRDGSKARAIAANDQDIIDFRFTKDGTALVYKIRDEAQQQAILRYEALQGFHYDERSFPFFSSRPFPIGKPGDLHLTASLTDGSIHKASSDEIAMLSPKANDGPEPIMVPNSKGIYHIAMQSGRTTLTCASSLCTDIEGTPWLSAPNMIGYMRREGWAKGTTAIYQWSPGAAAPRRHYATTDLLIDCAPFGQDVLCGREGSKRPRTLERINLKTRRSSTLFDPNPAFHTIALGRVERLNWKNDRGIECFGDLTYPPDYQLGKAYPLVVVQYESRGFLRGGTGDEYPVQLFARAGYLVLTVQRPRSPFYGLGLASIERQRLQNKDFVERRSILSAIETKVSQLVDAGIADPDRIGITGLSDGSTTVQFAALHSRLFRAAAVSGCCWEPSQTWILGPALQAHYHALGWPASPQDDIPMWRDISLSRNASHVAFPLLIQAADGEYRVALEAVHALRAAASPVDLFVFPDEAHIKRHPAQRASLYARNLRWFDFWLLGKRPAGNGPDAQEVSRWADMQRAWPKKE